MQITVTVNGEEHTRDVEPRLLLVHFLRDELGLTGTHWGCDTSNCGVCVVLARRRAGQVLHGARGHGRRPRGAHRRGPGAGRHARPGAAGLRGLPRPAVRLLHAGHDDDRPLAARPATPTRPRTRSARRSPGRCAGAPATRTSSAPSGGPPRTAASARARRRPRRWRRHDNGGGDPRRATARCSARRTRGSSAAAGTYVDDVTPARHAARRRAAQPVRPRPDRLHRHHGRRGAPEGQGGHHRRDAGRPQPGLDAHAVVRHAGRAGHRQGALPGPGGRVRRRRGPVRGPRRARADRRRVRAAARRGRRPAGARPGRAGHPRRQGRQDRQPHLRLERRRQGRDRRGVRRRRGRGRRRTCSTRGCTRRRWRPAARSPTSTRSPAS